MQTLFLKQVSESCRDSRECENDFCCVQVSESRPECQWRNQGCQFQVYLELSNMETNNQAPSSATESEGTFTNQHAQGYSAHGTTKPSNERTGRIGSSDLDYEARYFSQEQDHYNFRPGGYEQGNGDLAVRKDRDRVRAQKPHDYGSNPGGAEHHYASNVQEEAHKGPHISEGEIHRASITGENSTQAYGTHISEGNLDSNRTHYTTSGFKPQHSKEQNIYIGTSEHPYDYRDDDTLQEKIQVKSPIEETHHFINDFLDGNREIVNKYATPVKPTANSQEQIHAENVKHNLREGRHTELYVHDSKYVKPGDYGTYVSGNEQRKWTSSSDGGFQQQTRKRPNCTTGNPINEEPKQINVPDSRYSSEQNHVQPPQDQLSYKGTSFYVDDKNPEANRPIQNSNRNTEGPMDHQGTIGYANHQENVEYPPNQTEKRRKYNSQPNQEFQRSTYQTSVSRRPSSNKGHDYQASTKDIHIGTQIGISTTTTSQGKGIVFGSKTENGYYISSQKQEDANNSEYSEDGYKIKANTGSFRESPIKVTINRDNAFKTANIFKPTASSQNKFQTRHEYEDRRQEDGHKKEAKDTIARHEGAPLNRESIRDSSFKNTENQHYSGYDYNSRFGQHDTRYQSHSSIGTAFDNRERSAEDVKNQNHVSPEQKFQQHHPIVEYPPMVGQRPKFEERNNGPFVQSSEVPNSSPSFHATRGRPTADIYGTNHTDRNLKPSVQQPRKEHSTIFEKQGPKLEEKNKRPFDQPTVVPNRRHGVYEERHPVESDAGNLAARDESLADGYGTNYAGRNQKPMQEDRKEQSNIFENHPGTYPTEHGTDDSHSTATGHPSTLNDFNQGTGDQTQGSQMDHTSFPIIYNHYHREDASSRSKGHAISYGQSNTGSNLEHRRNLRTNGDDSGTKPHSIEASARPSMEDTSDGMVSHGNYDELDSRWSKNKGQRYQKSWQSTRKDSHNQQGNWELGVWIPNPNGM